MWWIVFAVYLLNTISTYFIHLSYEEHKATNQITLMGMSMFWPGSVIIGIYKLYKKNEKESV